VASDCLGNISVRRGDATDIDELWLAFVLKVDATRQTIDLSAAP